MSPLFVRVSQEQEHRWQVHHPLTDHCHIGHPSPHSNQEEFHSFRPVDGHRMVLKPSWVPCPSALLAAGTGMAAPGMDIPGLLTTLIVLLLWHPGEVKWP